MPIKGSTLLVAASLTANAALLALVVVRAPSAFRFGPLGPAQVVGQPAAPAAARPAPAIGTPGAGNWSGLNPADLRAQVARLRAAGFPPNLVRAIIQAQVNELFAARRRALMAQMEVKPYWSSRFGSWDPKVLEGFKAIGRDQAKLIKDLLGPDAEPSNSFYGPFAKEMNGGLSPEKNKLLQTILSDYNDLKNQVYNSASGGMLLPEDNEKLAYLEKEQQADLAAALSPGELFEYQLRTSGTASQLRNILQAFNPSEEEFRSIFRVQQAFDEKYGSPGDTLSPEQQSERQAHQGEVLDQLQSVLSPDRVADYKRETDPNYVQVNRLVQRLDLPQTTTDQVVALQDDISKRAEAIRHDPGLAAADRNIQLAALANEATTKAASILGESGFAAYKQTSGAWILGLTPPAK